MDHAGAPLRDALAEYHEYDLTPPAADDRVRRILGVDAADSSMRTVRMVAD
ncbi:hypothetical protein AB0L63_32455 [Nocardia sp. NPDC051990]|uniref:hypothetical protein n=1 Tax=Nocardia sp. NPDC051990 TaxID=3155285 RepID=UPI0034410091